LSIKLTSQVWERQISGPQRLILLILADYARDDGSRCYPAVKTLMYKTGGDRRSVQRTLAKLRTRGVLIVERQGRGRGRSTVYRINLEALPAKGIPPLDD
jgi:hypothetical protein